MIYVLTLERTRWSEEILTTALSHSHLDDSDRKIVLEGKKFHYIHRLKRSGKPNDITTEDKNNYPPGHQTHANVHNLDLCLDRYGQKISNVNTFVKLIFNYERWCIQRSLLASSIPYTQFAVIADQKSTVMDVAIEDEITVQTYERNVLNNYGEHWFQNSCKYFARGF